MKISALVCALACGTAAIQTQQATSARDTQIAKADAAFQQRAWQTAADGYRAITHDDPANGMAWFRLGMSLDQLGTAPESDKSDESLEAYGHASQLGFQIPRAELAIARILVRKGSAPQALEHVRKILALGAPLAIIDTDPALAPMRSLPEYAALKSTADAARFPCRAVHTFDFWAGDFDAKPWDQPGAPSGGTLHNTRELDGCVFVERWDGARGTGSGMSMSFYDTTLGKWRMVWNDDGNGAGEFEGSYHDGAMHFEASTVDANGKRQLISNVLQDVSPDVIRHTFSTSDDGGKTWRVVNDERFVRRKQ